MADEKIITSSVFEQGITEIMQDIANNLYEFEEYTEEEVADLMDLSEEEVIELTRVINDTTVALNKVYSNKKVEDLLSELEVTCNKYADEKIGGLTSIHLAYVDSLPSLGEDNTIYILKSTTGNDTLNLYDGTSWISIGEFAISLDNYYDKAEIDALLNGKANANEVIGQDDVVSDMSNISSSTVLSTAGLEVELNKKVDKDSIATVLDNTVTDDKVPSAKAVYDGLESINDFNVQVVKEKLDLNDITETGIYFFPQTYTPVNIPVGVNGWLLVMKGSSSDIVKQVWYRLGTSNSYNTFERYKGGNTWSEWTKFLTEKEYYNALDHGNPIIPQDADLNDYLTAGVYTCMSSTIAETLANCPHITSNFKLIVNKNRGNDDTLFYGYQMIVGTAGGNPVTDVCVYYRGISMYDNVCVFSKWKIMSGSTVADVPVTYINTFENKTYVKPAETNVCSYYVTNGRCELKLGVVCLSTTNNFVQIISGLPKPKSAVYSNVTDLIMSNSGARGVFQLITDGTLKIVCSYGDSSIAGDRFFYTTLSYPVAEE